MAPAELDTLFSLRESCGVVGICGTDNVVNDVITGLSVLQHRGQESAGLAFAGNGGKRLVRKIGMGLVTEAFRGRLTSEDKSDTCIGHVRYSTTGDSKLENTQPFVVGMHSGDIAIAHNGDIVNSKLLRQEALHSGNVLVTDTDSELMIRHLAKKISHHEEVGKAIESLFEKLVGSYSCVFLRGNELYAFRDPYGFRPLSIGELPDKAGMIVCSESVAIDALGGTLVRDVRPGEIVRVHKNKVESLAVHRGNEHTGMCMFEWVYFSRPDSVLDGQEVYSVRRKIGAELAKEHPVKADVVIPVPDSGRAHALGYCEQSGIPYAEGFMKNRFVERSFILPTQEQRRHAVRMKLNAIRSVVNGKRVVLVDDSIVRGTTMKAIIGILRRGGAKQVHLRIGCMPIIAPCYFGVDMKTREQFIATGRNTKQIAKELGCDSLGYISKEGLVNAIGFPADDLCLGCLTGEYPVPVQGERSRYQKRLDSF